MTDISVNGLVKSFELGKNILDGLSFDIAEGERVGILGHNGCGKTTLFRILTGEIDYDEGAVAIASGKRLGLISQIPVYPDGWTTEDVLRDAHRELYAISARLDELAHEMEHDQSDKLLSEYDRLSADFARLGGYDMDTDRNRVANGLDIPQSMREQPFDLLSGGLMLGAFFMATDYTTSPLYFWGRVVFAVGCGALTLVIREFGSLPEGVSYSIILMNILTPLIERYIKPRAFGLVKEKRTKEAAKS